MSIPKLGDKKTFVPTEVGDKHSVTGRIVFNHAEHRWYRVAYQLDTRTMHECFKF